MANGADPEGKIVWKYKPITQSVYDSTVQAPMTSTSASPSTGNNTNKVQDDRDMAMIKTEDTKIFAVERYTCKSSFFVAIINRFGETGGFESLLKLIVKPEVSLENLYYLVSFFVKSHQMFHK